MLFCSQFRLSYYPHQKDAFTKLLKDVFGSYADHSVYGDFKSLEEEPEPAFYIHIIEKEWNTPEVHSIGTK